MANRAIRPATALAVLLLIPLLRPISAPSPPHARFVVFRPDLNHDPAHRIRLVPGIGPKRAIAIVEERRAHGPYVDHADVGRRVPGIGPVLVGRLREFTERVHTERDHTERDHTERDQ